MGARVTLLPNTTRLGDYRKAVMQGISMTGDDMSYFVLLNGEIIGYTDDPVATVEYVRAIGPLGEHRDSPDADR